MGAMVATRRTNEERTAETRARLMRAAVDALVELGWSGATTNEIARRAGVSRGAMLHHYPSKADLVAGAVEHLIDLRRARFEASMGALRRGERPVGSILETIWEIYAGETLDAWLELVVAGRTDPALGATLREIDRRFFDRARAVAAALVLGDRGPGASAEVEAEIRAFSRMVLAFFDGLAVNRMVSDRDDDRRAALRLFEALVARWIAELRAPGGAR